MAERDGNPTGSTRTIRRGLVHASDLSAEMAAAVQAAWIGPVCLLRRPIRKMRIRSNGCQVHSEPCRSANCAPNPAASLRSCWMASHRRSRHWPTDATDCRATICRLAQPADRGCRPVPRLPVGRADPRATGATRPHTTRRRCHMSQRSSDVDPRITRIVTALAAAIALAVGVVLPGHISCPLMRSGMPRLPPRANLPQPRYRRSPAATRSVEFENARIRGLLSMLGQRPEPERRIVSSGAGQEVAVQGDALPQPVMTAVTPVYNSGAIVGNVKIQRSLQELLVITAFITVLAGSLGAVTFAVLRGAVQLLRRALARSTHLATHDTLTGLPNRALFRDQLEQSVRIVLARGYRAGRALPRSGPVQGGERQTGARHRRPAADRRDRQAARMCP